MRTLRCVCRSERVCACVCVCARARFARGLGQCVCVCARARVRDREWFQGEGVFMGNRDSVCVCVCVCVCVFTQTGIQRQRKCAGSPSARPDFLLRGRREKSCGSAFRRQQQQQHGAPTQHTHTALRRKHTHPAGQTDRGATAVHSWVGKFPSPSNFLEGFMHNRDTKAGLH